MHVDENRYGQRSCGFDSFFKKAGKLAKQAVKSNLSRIPISKCVEHLPSLYRKGASRIKNKKLIALLNSNIAHGIGNTGDGKVGSRFS